MKNATHVVKPWHLSYQSSCLLINRLMKSTEGDDFTHILGIYFAGTRVSDITVYTDGVTSYKI